MQIVEAPSSAEAKRFRRKRQCGGLRKFKTLFTLRSERLFATLDLLPPLFSCQCPSTHGMYAQNQYSLLGAYLFICTPVQES